MTGPLLREKIEEVVGKNTRLGDARTRLANSFRQHDERQRPDVQDGASPNFMNDCKLSAADVAMATAAAPLYFLDGQEIETATSSTAALSQTLRTCAPCTKQSIS